MSRGRNHFFIVGGQRCGTTYLAERLSAHPEIAMAQPVRPEPKYFLSPGAAIRGAAYYVSRYFDSASMALVLGEKSTSYAESDRAAESIASLFPQARILFVLRDPLERAVSNYWFSVNHGAEALPLRDAFLQEEARVDQYDRKAYSTSPFAYLRRGRYIEQVERYDRCFPSDQVSIRFYEELMASPSELDAICRFLGVEEGLLAPDPSPVRVNASDREESGLDDDLRATLEAYFEDSNDRLAQRLGRPVPSAWSHRHRGRDGS
jgi:hypothetical protein